MTREPDILSMRDEGKATEEQTEHAWWRTGVEWGLLALVVLVPLVVLPNAKESVLIKSVLVDLLVGAMAGLWILGHLWGSPSRGVQWTSLDLPVLAWVGIGLVSVVMSDYRAWSFRAWWTMAIYVLLFFLVTRCVRDRQGVRRILYGISVVGGMTAVYGILQAFGVGVSMWSDRFLTVNYQPRSFSTLGHPNVFGGFLVIALMLSLGLWFGERSVRRRVVVGGMIGAMLVALLYTLSRGAWIGLMAGLAVIGLWKTRRASVRVRVLSFALMGLALILGMILWPSLWQRILSGENIQNRVAIWKGAYKMFRARPVWGWGIGTFALYFPRFRPWDYWLHGVEIHVRHAHNEYLEILSEIGGIGLVVFLVLLGMFFRCGWSVARRGSDRELNHWMMGLCAAMVGTLVHSVVSVSLRWTSTGVLFWMGLGLGATVCGLALSGDRREETGERRHERGRMSSWPLPLRLGLSLAVLTGLGWMSVRDVGVICSERALFSGEQALSKHDLPKAVEALERAVQGDSHNMRALYRLGFAYLAVGKGKQALEAFERLERLVPDYAEIHRNKGVTYLRLGRLDEAINAYRRSIAVHANHEDEYDLARVLETKGRREEAALHYERFLPLAAAFLDLHRSWKAWHEAHGKKEEAQKEVAMISEELQKVHHAYDRLMAYYVHEGAWDRAVRTFEEQAARGDPEDGRVYFSLGVALEQKGEYEQAKTAYRRALSLTPDHGPTLNNLGLLLAREGEGRRGGDALLPLSPSPYLPIGGEGGEGKNEAVALVRRAMVVDEGNRLNYMDSLGWVYYLQGNVEQAIATLSDALRRALEEKGRRDLQAEMAFHLGMSFYKKGDLAAAERALRQSLEIAPKGAYAAQAERTLATLETVHRNAR